MAAAKQLTGMRGVYLVAAELSRLGFIASPTSRSAIGADVLVTDQACQRAYSVQVKTNTKVFNFWLLNEKARTMVSPHYLYVFVNLRHRQLGEVVEYFVVPSGIVAEKMVSDTAKSGKKSEWHMFYLKDAKPFKDNWAAFGDAWQSSEIAKAILPDHDEDVIN